VVFTFPTDAAETDEENRKYSELPVEPETNIKIGSEPRLLIPFLGLTGELGSRRRFLRKVEGTRILGGYKGQVDWVSFLLGHFFFGQAKKKYLGYRDQP
jgi:hypothetical protein